jgi:hypothetical protein
VERDFTGNLQQLQARWFTVVFVAVRVNLMKNLIETKQSERMRELRDYRSAVSIQRWYRGILESRQASARKGALMIIARVFSRFYRRWKAERLRNASLVIHSFFKEVYDVSKLLKIVKKYRLSVIKAQRYVKSFLKVREARVLVISKHWDQVESVWWSQRIKGGRNSVDLEDKKVKLKKKKKKDDADKTSHKFVEYQSVYAGTSNSE